MTLGNPLKIIKLAPPRADEVLDALASTVYEEGDYLVLDYATGLEIHIHSRAMATGGQLRGIMEHFGLDFQAEG